MFQKQSFTFYETLEWGLCFHSELKYSLGSWRAERFAHSQRQKASVREEQKLIFMKQEYRQLLSRSKQVHRRQGWLESFVL
jgi:hypothetical protein